jgi:hypothetical protein
MQRIPPALMISGDVKISFRTAISLLHGGCLLLLLAKVTQQPERKTLTLLKRVFDKFLLGCKSGKNLSNYITVKVLMSRKIFCSLSAVA